MTADILNQQNKKVGEIDLPESVFNAKWNPDLVHQVLSVQVANKRHSLAHTKDRSEVRGGGKKPWRQKGTGRSRQGSRRSPLWSGGGITFGPRNEKIFARKINKKMKRIAVASVLSKKLADHEIKIVDNFNIPDHKTKNLQLLVKSVIKNSSALLVAESKNKNIYAASRNLPKIFASSADNLNVYDLLAKRYVIFSEASVKELVKQ
ncbi:MAG: 50S ribosomal protein L4 [Candidatus Brennerbacteria bacterium]|nr:50S ribosomal protein L4 [Candidatus Brennerbacteria bacterium]